MNTSVTSPTSTYRGYHHSDDMADPVSASDSSDNAMEEEENRKKRVIRSSEGGVRRPPAHLSSSQQQHHQHRQQACDSSSSTQATEATTTSSSAATTAPNKEAEAGGDLDDKKPAVAAAAAAAMMMGLAPLMPGAHHVDDDGLVLGVVENKKKKATPRVSLGERRPPAPAPKPPPPPSTVTLTAGGAASSQNNNNSNAIGQQAISSTETEDAGVKTAEGRRRDAADNPSSKKKVPEADAVLDRAAPEAAKIRAYSDSTSSTNPNNRAPAPIAGSGPAAAGRAVEVAEDDVSPSNDVEVGLDAEEEVTDEINPPAVQLSVVAAAAAAADRDDGYGDDEEELEEERAEPSLSVPLSPRIPMPSSPDEENQERAPDVPIMDASSSISPHPPVEGGDDGNDADDTDGIRSTRPNGPPTAVSGSATSLELPQAIPVPDTTTSRTETSIMMGGRGTDNGGGTAPGTSPEVVQAHPLEPYEANQEVEKKSFRNCLSPTQWAVGALLIVVLIVVGVVVGITQKSKDDDNGLGNGGSSSDGIDGSRDSIPTVSPSFSVAPRPPAITDPPSSCIPFPPFNEDLHFLTLQALKEPCSPQSKANSWMMQDPNRDLYGPKRKLQRFALATLFYSTSGQNWKNNDLWLDYDKDECQWYNQDAINNHDGETMICNEDSSIMHLNLARNNLDGVLPVELFFFPALATLDLSNNRLYGTAPTMFNGARYLERLVLSSNQLTGQFTAELGFVASKLAVLHNDDNMFTGAVPGLLRLLPRLSDLNITGNQYTGALPGSLIQLSDHLTSIEVSDNGITGVIPTELAAASKLQRIDVGGNPQLGGTIPTELAALTSLRTLDISNTAISGNLPENLCELQQGGALEVLADCGGGGSFQCCGV